MVGVFEKIIPVVSNSPCGVESQNYFLYLSSVKLFLIHRVELKEHIS